MTLRTLGCPEGCNPLAPPVNAAKVVEGHDVVQRILARFIGQIESLHVWIPNSRLAQGGAGVGLAAQLQALSIAPSSSISVYVYALGNFRTWPAGVPTRLVLDLEHPHMCWIA